MTTQRAWKPGQIALVRAGAFDGVVVALRSGVPSNMGWAYTGDDGKYGNCWMSDPEGSRAIRPLFVLDIPNVVASVDEARSVAKNPRRDAHPDSTNAHIADQIESQLTPPKPAEPTGLGAVVEDINGHLHTRAREHEQPFVGGDGTWRPYSDIAATTIHSHGWSS